MRLGFDEAANREYVNTAVAGGTVAGEDNGAGTYQFGA